MIYKHKVQYYETDKMGITHHSNYIRWMEEARVVFLDEIGLKYSKLEESGIVSPVLSVTADYKKTTTFDEMISIDVHIVDFTGVKMKFSYEMTNAAGDVVCSAESKHCFLNEKGMPVRLKKDYPDIYETGKKAMDTGF